MSTPAQLRNLVDGILRDFPSAGMEWDPFPSGVRVLYVSLNDRDFELEYNPHQGTGVSENFEDTPPFIGHDQSFDSLDQAIEQFKAMLASAQRGEPASRTAAMALHDQNSPES